MEELVVETESWTEKYCGAPRQGLCGRAWKGEGLVRWIRAGGGALKR